MKTNLPAISDSPRKNESNRFMLERSLEADKEFSRQIVFVTMLLKSGGGQS
jgi:hypothetical protein